MRLDHSEVVLGFDGKALRNVVGGTSQEPEMQDWTFKILAITALLTVPDGDRMGAEEKSKAYHLAEKFQRGKRVTLTVDEASFLNRRAGIVLPPMLVGRLAGWLEGDPQLVATDELNDDEGES